MQTCLCTISCISSAMLPFPGFAPCPQPTLRIWCTRVRSSICLPLCTLTGWIGFQKLNVTSMGWIFMPQAPQWRSLAGAFDKDLLGGPHCSRRGCLFVGLIYCMDMCMPTLNSSLDCSHVTMASASASMMAWTMARLRQGRMHRCCV